MTCNSDRCHCPDCNEARRERTQDARIGSLETRVDRLEIHKHRRNCPDHAAAVRRHDYERERAERYIPTEGQRKVKCTGPRGRVYVGYKEAPNLEWRWEQQTGPDRWCRRMIYSPYNYLGRPVFRRYFTPDGHRIKDPPLYASGGVVRDTPGGWLRPSVSMSRDEYIEITANVNSAEHWLDEKVRDEAFPTKTPFTELKKDSPTMSISASALAVLTYIHAHSPRADDPDITGRQARDGFTELLQSELVVSYGAIGPRLTERGKVLIAAIRALPLPVREEAPWVMPKA